MSTIWTHQYSSGESHTDFEFPNADEPCSWFAPSTSGTVVIVNEGGSVLTYAAVGGEVVRGRFTSLTSNSCTKLLCGNGEPPSPALATAGTSSVASVDTRVSASESAVTSVVSRFSAVDSGESSADTSIISRLSAVDSALASADTSVVSRFSAVDSSLVSADTSVVARLSAVDSSLASGIASVASA